MYYCIEIVIKDWEPEDLISSVVSSSCPWCMMLVKLLRLSEPQIPLMCLSDVIEVKTLSSYTYFIFWGISASAAAWSCCYNIKAKPNGNHKILLVGLVWFFNRFKSDSPHNCYFQRQILGLCTSQIFVFSYNVFSSEHYFNLKTHCGESFNVLF